MVGDEDRHLHSVVETSQYIGKAPHEASFFYEGSARKDTVNVVPMTAIEIDIAAANTDDVQSVERQLNLDKRLLEVQ